MHAIVEREAATVLCGTVQVDDAYLGGERVGGTAGRCSENKVPFIGAIAIGLIAASICALCRPACWWPQQLAVPAPNRGFGGWLTFLANQVTPLPGAQAIVIRRSFEVRL
jgi:hypothetical protein